MSAFLGYWVQNDDDDDDDAFYLYCNFLKPKVLHNAIKHFQYAIKKTLFPSAVDRLNVFLIISLFDPQWPMVKEYINCPSTILGTLLWFTVFLNVFKSYTHYNLRLIEIMSQNGKQKSTMLSVAQFVSNITDELTTR